MPRFRVSTARSTVEVDLDVNLHPSHVRTGDLRGTLECEFDSNGRPRLDVTYAAELALPVASMRSGNALQDREMRRRFDVRRYPEVTARLLKARANRDGSYRAAFELTMHGHTRRVSGNARLAVRDGLLTIDGEQRINMRRFGIDPPRLLILRMDEVVNVRAHIEARELRGPGTPRRS